MVMVFSELQNRARVFNTTTPAANADILTTAISNKLTYSSFMNIYCCFSAAGVLSMTRTVGAATITELLNGGLTLTAGACYDFTVMCQTDTTLNFRYSAGSGTTYIFSVDELTA